MIGTVTLLDVAGMTKVVTVGSIVSGKVIAILAVTGAETLPAASLAKAYRVKLPAVLKVKELDAVDDQPEMFASGVVAVSVRIYPVTAVLSLAEKEITGTVKLVEVVGTVKTVTVGAVVSARVIVAVSETGAEIFPEASLAKA